GCEVRFMVSHRQIAAHLDATGLPATYLAPALYMEDLLAFAGRMRETAEISVPTGHGRVGFVAASDVAAVAAQALTGPGHEGATYTLTGPEALRFKDVAGRISAVFAREVDYTDQSPDRARQQLLADGVSGWQADGNLELFDWIRQGGADTVTAAVREVTGADPQPLPDWLEESRADFEVPPLDLPRSLF
ncbi:MAG: hypothetical protein ACRDPD_19520, partial [Streptosporangiaceae bacterium]